MSFWTTLITFGFWCECPNSFPSELGHFEGWAFFHYFQLAHRDTMAIPLYSCSVIQHFSQIHSKLFTFLTDCFLNQFWLNASFGFWCRCLIPGHPIAHLKGHLYVLFLNYGQTLNEERLWAHLCQTQSLMKRTISFSINILRMGSIK